MIPIKRQVYMTMSTYLSVYILNGFIMKNLGGNYLRMLRAISNKSWKQHPTKQLPNNHLPLISETIQVKRTRHAGKARTNS